MTDFRFGAEHTLEAFQARCDRFFGAHGFAFTDAVFGGRPEDFDPVTRDEISFLDAWDCWLFTEDAQDVLA